MTSPHRIAPALYCLALLTASVAAPGIAYAGPAEAQQSADDAQIASADGDHERALELLERAYVAHPSPVYLYARILVLEQMGQFDLALQILEENRDDLMAHPEINDLVVIEQRLQNADAGPGAQPVDTIEGSDAPSDIRAVSVEAPAADQGASLLGWSLVGGSTAAIAAGSAIALLGGADLDRVQCSGSAIGSPGCEDIEPYPERNEAGLREREDDAQLQVNAGIGLGLVGAGLLGWGVYELLADERPDGPDGPDGPDEDEDEVVEKMGAAARSARIRISPRSDGASATFELRF